MKESELTQAQALEWLRSNRPFLNLKAIASELECDPSLLTRAVNGKNPRGYEVPFPPRCLPAMQQIIQRFILPKEHS